MKKSKLLILYDWFYPGFKAGGPIQSLTNLAILLAAEFEVFVLTQGFDLNAEEAYGEIVLDEWNKIHLPASEQAIKVFYANKSTLTTKKLRLLFIQIQPHIIYLNGIFSFTFFVLPLMIMKRWKDDFKIVVCPRGMLKKGALSGKTFKKQIYIKLLKITGLLSRVLWHATSAEEVKDIGYFFPINKGVITAPNIPKPPVNTISFIQKKPGELRLVYLSLINEHKNLLLLLQLLMQAKSNIKLDIYGPVIDEHYFDLCKEVIRKRPGSFAYKGLVRPSEVHEVLLKYHALILLTKGENFGHSLFESLGAGRPCITTNFTPWNNLSEQKAGVNVDLNNAVDCLKKINDIAQLSQQEYDTLSLGAHTVAINYYKNLHSDEKYMQLFL